MGGAELGVGEFPEDGDDSAELGVEEVPESGGGAELEVEVLVGAVATLVEVGGFVLSSEISR